MKEAILLLNMGGPSSLYEVDTFLKNMFNDPCILSIKNSFLRKMVANFIVNKRVAKSKNIYKVIGGKSPITELTFSLVQKLQDKDKDRFYSYAMRYTPPYTDLALKELQDKGIEKITLFSMYPQYSTTTTLSSFTEVYKGLKKLDYKPIIDVIDRYYYHNAFNQNIIQSIKKSLEGKNSSDFVLIFSAHSLPQSVVDKGDPYQKECEENIEILKTMLLKEKIHFKDICLSYQSKIGPMKWIGPDTQDLIKKYKNNCIIIYPLSFTIDNSETKYELDIQYRKLALDLNIKEYITCPCLNDTDGFVGMILQLVNERKSK